MTAVLRTSAAVLLLGAAGLGCGDGAPGRAGASTAPAGQELRLEHGKGVVGDGPREGLPGTPGGARIVSVPRFGTMTWRCDTSRRPVRYATSLRIPRNSATVTGTVKTPASARTRFTVHPGDAVSTPMTEDRLVRWDLRSHHKPAPRTLRVELRMDHVAQSGECVLVVAGVRRTESRRR